VVPILPSILRDKVGVPDKDIQSDVSGLLAAYAAASVITSPFAGVIADRLSSRRAPFLVGLLALLLATILLFVGTTLPVLAIARVLQGISSAFVWTVGLALCLETVGPKNLGKTIGSVSHDRTKDYAMMVD
jgi:MFS family permease